jgi:hypothetical protein
MKSFHVILFLLHNLGSLRCRFFDGLPGVFLRGFVHQFVHQFVNNHFINQFIDQLEQRSCLG